MGRTASGNQIAQAAALSTIDTSGINKAIGNSIKQVRADKEALFNKIAEVQARADAAGLHPAQREYLEGKIGEAKSNYKGYLSNQNKKLFVNSKSLDAQTEMSRVNGEVTSFQSSGKSVDALHQFSITNPEIFEGNPELSTLLGEYSDNIENPEWMIANSWKLNNWKQDVKRAGTIDKSVSEYLSVQEQSQGIGLSGGLAYSVRGYTNKTVTDEDAQKALLKGGVIVTDDVNENPEMVAEKIAEFKNTFDINVGKNTQSKYLGKGSEFATEFKMQEYGVNSPKQLEAANAWVNVVSSTQGILSDTTLDRGDKAERLTSILFKDDSNSVINKVTKDGLIEWENKKTGTSGVIDPSSPVTYLGLNIIGEEARSIPTNSYNKIFGIEVPQHTTTQTPTSGGKTSNADSKPTNIKDLVGELGQKYELTLNRETGKQETKISFSDGTEVPISITKPEDLEKAITFEVYKKYGLNTSNMDDQIDRTANSEWDVDLDPIKVNNNNEMKRLGEASQVVSIYKHTTKSQNKSGLGKDTIYFKIWDPRTKTQLKSFNSLEEAQSYVENVQKAESEIVSMLDTSNYGSKEDVVENTYY